MYPRNVKENETQEVTDWNSTSTKHYVFHNDLHTNDVKSSCYHCPFGGVVSRRGPELLTWKKENKLPRQGDVCGYTGLAEVIWLFPLLGMETKGWLYVSKAKWSARQTLWSDQALTCWWQRLSLAHSFSSANRNCAEKSPAEGKLSILMYLFKWQPLFKEPNPAEENPIDGQHIFDKSAFCENAAGSHNIHLL